MIILCHHHYLEQFHRSCTLQQLASRGKKKHRKHCIRTSQCRSFPLSFNKYYVIVKLNFIYIFYDYEIKFLIDKISLRKYCYLSLKMCIQKGISQNFTYIGFASKYDKLSLILSQIAPAAVDTGSPRLISVSIINSRSQEYSIIPPQLKRP